MKKKEGGREGGMEGRTYLVGSFGSRDEEGREEGVPLLDHTVLGDGRGREHGQGAL